MSSPEHCLLHQSCFYAKNLDLIEEESLENLQVQDFEKVKYSLVCKFACSLWTISIQTLAHGCYLINKKFLKLCSKLEKLKILYLRNQIWLDMLAHDPYLFDRFD